MQSCEPFINKLQQLSVERFTTKVAIRRIQRNWKEKARKNLALAATVLKARNRLRRGLKKRANRTQFN